MGSSSSRPLLELQRSARITDGMARLPQLTQQVYLRGDDVVAEFKLRNLNTELKVLEVSHTI